MSGKINLSVIADKELRRKRLSICSACPHNEGDKKCTKCGCALKPKITLRLAKCPLHKW